MADDVFDARWLKLRERSDHGARSRWLVGILRVEGRRRGWSCLVDLGAGTGSNLRYMSGRLPWARQWILVDHDASLLADAHPPTPDVQLRAVVGDLGDAGLASVPGAHVVTASALLDLVSEDWLRRLRDRCVDAGAAAYFALSYDGVVRWHHSSDEEADAFVFDAVNEHQRRDKGVGGGALGPVATETAARLFQEAGYRVEVAPSPWRLVTPKDTALLEALIAGWIDAAAEVRPGHEERIRAWGGARVRNAREGTVRVEVGHTDLLAIPPDAAAAVAQEADAGVAQDVDAGVAQDVDAGVAQDADTR